jgi:hypothetical protein
VISKRRCDCVCIAFHPIDQRRMPKDFSDRWGLRRVNIDSKLLQIFEISDGRIESVICFVTS